MLDLNELEQKLDDSLAKETPESLKSWLDNKRNMYKLMKLSDSLYIIVSDEEIDVEDIAFDTDTKELFQVIGFGHAGLIRSQTDTYIADACKKVVCTTEKFTYAPAKHIPLEEIKELLGITTRNKVWARAMSTCFPSFDSNRDILSYNDQKILENFTNGYWAALADTKDKQFTLKDMEAMYVLGQQVGVNIALLQHKSTGYTPPPFEEVLPKPKTEWDVDFIEGTLKLK